MRKKSRKQQAARGGISVFSTLESTPVTEKLATKGWPPRQLSSRLERIADSLMPTDPYEVPSCRALQVVQGMAGALVGRLGADPAAAALREQLEMLEEALPIALAIATEHKSKSPPGEPPLETHAWELLAIAASVLSDLQNEALSEQRLAVAQKTVSIALSSEELRAIVEQGGLAPDTLAAMLPSAAGNAELSFAQAAEACFFLSVAVIQGPEETREPIYGVADRIATALEAMRPPEEEDTTDADAAWEHMFPLERRGGQRKSAKKAAPKRSSQWFQLKITLRHIKPPIWRRIVIPDCNLAELDEYVKTAMGWAGSHLSCFDIDGEAYSPPNPFSGEVPDDTEDARRSTLGQFVRQGIKKFGYDYDFGDGWEHSIVVEKVLTKEQAPSQPACTDGARACPPEDCGGVPGYYELLEALKNPQRPENQEKLDWLCDKWDPESFDPQEVTSLMR
jgi:hypothetical protein